MAASKPSPPDGVIEQYLRTGAPKARVAAKAAIGALSTAELSALSAALRARTEPPAGTHAAPGQEYERFDSRRIDLLGSVIAPVLRDRRTSEGDEALSHLLEHPPTAHLACHAALGAARLSDDRARWLPPVPPASDRVLSAIAAHLRPNDPLAAEGLIAAQLLGDATAVARFAASKDGGPTFTEMLIRVFALCRELSSELLTLAIENAPSVQHCLAGPLLEDRASPEILLEALERMPGNYLDESISKGLLRGMDAEQRARLSQFLARAEPRRLTAKFAKLAAQKAGARDLPKSKGVVATEGAPVLLGAASALRGWQGALPDMPPRGDYHEACALPAFGALTRDGMNILVLSSHESRAELLDAGKDGLLIVLSGDPADAWAERSRLPLADLPIDLGEGPFALLDASFTVRSSKNEQGHYLTVGKRGLAYRLGRAVTDSFDVLALCPVREGSG